MSNYLPIYSMLELIKSVVLRHRNMDRVEKILAGYGIERIENKRFKCIDTKSKFYGKVCIIKCKIIDNIVYI